MQIHESVLNNGIQRLQLNGRTFTLPELSKQEQCAGQVEGPVRFIDYTREAKP